MSRFRAASSLAFALLLVATPALADDKQACLQTYVDGQAHRKDGKLLAARQALLTCARPVCPKEIRTDCASWLKEVDESVPTLVVSATDEHGDALASASVSIDGVASSSTLGKAISVDPGAHTIRLQAPEKPALDKQIVIAEGTKNQLVSFEYPRAEPKAPPLVALPLSVATRPTPTSVWILSGVAVVSLAVAGAVGANAVWGSPGYRSLGECRPRCSPDDVSSVDRRLRIADVALGVGVLSASIAFVLYVTRPTHDPTVGFTPLVVAF